MDRKHLVREIDANLELFRLGAITGTDTVITGTGAKQLVDLLIDLKKIVAGRVVISGLKTTYYDADGKPWLVEETVDSPKS